MSLPVRLLIVVGLAALLLAGVLYFLERSGIQLGRLPGDIRIVRGNFTCLIGLGTSLLLSIVLTVVLNLLARWLK